MSIIVVASAAGGSGKTTAVLCLAAALATMPDDAAPTILLDLDPAGDATRRVGRTHEEALLGPLIDGRRRASDAMGAFTVIEAAHATSEGFSIVPASDDIALVETRFDKMAGGTELLIYRLHALGRDCRLVVDTAPGIVSVLGRASIMAADVVIVPVIPGPDAARSVLDIVGMVRGTGGGAQVFIVATATDGTGADIAALNGELRDAHLALSASFPRESAVGLSALKRGTPLALAPESQCALSYRSLARKVGQAIAQRSGANRTRGRARVGTDPRFAG